MFLGYKILIMKNFNLNINYSYPQFFMINSLLQIFLYQSSLFTLCFPEKRDLIKLSRI